MTKRQPALIATCMLALAMLGTGAEGASVILSDTEFADANWTTLEVTDETPNNSFSFSGTQLLAGGNPGAYRQVIQELNTPTASKIQSGHLFQGGNFDPGEDGSFQSLDVSFDGIGISGPAGAMGYGLLVEQGGDLFSKGFGQVLNGAGWTPFGGTGFVASDFLALTGGVLDLSDAGAAITLGFFVSNGTRGEPSINEGGVDNWSVTINLAEEVAAVPLPAAVWLFLSGLGGLGGLGWVGRRRTRKATGA